MATVEQPASPLAAGTRMSREEFMRRWEAHPEIKCAELIGGIVYLPSPVSVAHGDNDGDVGTWLGHYRAWTSGTAIGHNTTSFILDDAPQPDLNLRILPECGGLSWWDGLYLAGPPELLVEMCRSSAAFDLHEKLELYQAAKVPEYIVITLLDQTIHWHVLENGFYHLMPSDAAGVWRSRVFPGLWLDGPALFAGNMVHVSTKLDEGLKTAENRQFAEKLAKARRIK
jgi:Putative restriction endonuclease